MWLIALFLFIYSSAYAAAPPARSRLRQTECFLDIDPMTHECSAPDNPQCDCKVASDCPTCSNKCQGTECSRGLCIYPAFNNDDGNPCTEDICNPFTGQVQHVRNLTCCTTDRECPHTGGPCLYKTCTIDHQFSDGRGTCSMLPKEHCCVKDEDCVSDDDFCLESTCNFKTHTCTKPRPVVCHDQDGDRCTVPYCSNPTTPPWTNKCLEKDLGALCPGACCLGSACRKEKRGVFPFSHTEEVANCRDDLDAACCAGAGGVFVGPGILCKEPLARDVCCNKTATATTTLTKTLTTKTATTPPPTTVTTLASTTMTATLVNGCCQCDSGDCFQGISDQATCAAQEPAGSCIFVPGDLCCDVFAAGQACGAVITPPCPPPPCTEIYCPDPTKECSNLGFCNDNRCHVRLSPISLICDNGGRIPFCKNKPNETPCICDTCFCNPGGAGAGDELLCSSTPFTTTGPTVTKTVTTTVTTPAPTTTNVPGCCLTSVGFGTYGQYEILKCVQIGRASCRERV